MTVVSTIGSGQDYETIALWEDDKTGVLADIEKGTLIDGFATDEDFSISGSTTASDKYMWLTSVVDAEHDGRSNEVSSKGNARVEGSTNVGSITISDEFTELDWLEFDSNASGAEDIITFGGLSTCTITIHHCLFHNDGKSTDSDQIGFFLNDTDVDLRFFRNFMYGMGSSGAWIFAAAAGTEIYSNTFYENNRSNNAGRAGIESDSANATMQNNVAFDHLQNDVKEDAGTWDWNATSDGSATGANSIATVTSVAAELTNPTDTWANTDLTIKDTDAEIHAAGIENETEDPEFNVLITSRGTTLGAIWSIGADDIIVAGVLLIERFYENNLNPLIK